MKTRLYVLVSCAQPTYGFLSAEYLDLLQRKVNLGALLHPVCLAKTTKRMLATLNITQESRTIASKSEANEIKYLKQIKKERFKCLLTPVY